MKSHASETYEIHNFAKKRMSHNKRILVAMSGGLDSSMASLLLKEQGFHVIGGTFRTWDYISEGCLAKNTGCCSIEAIHEASSFASANDFEHHVLDMREQFRSEVIDPFVSEYSSGRTPNPCVVCNSKIKWGLMLRKAEELGCQYIATGHYAGIREKNGKYRLTNAKDQDKDQTYFLWQLTSEQLSRTLFPLSHYTKPQIRQMAEKLGFTRLSSGRESQEICFIPDNNYRKFIQDEYPDVMKNVHHGDVYDMNGNIIGQHKGFINYTIGQRKGLGIAVGEPAYVTAINPAENTITLGRKEDLLVDNLIVSNYNLNGFDEIPETFEAEVKIRYNTQRVHAMIRLEGNLLLVSFTQNVSAVTPGQSAVFYQQDECIGGGIIERASIEK
jgi:tRNA-uridine 2-sulfurtransferase